MHCRTVCKDKMSSRCHSAVVQITMHLSLFSILSRFVPKNLLGFASMHCRLVRKGTEQGVTQLLFGGTAALSASCSDLSDSVELCIKSHLPKMSNSRPTGSSTNLGTAAHKVKILGFQHNSGLHLLPPASNCWLRPASCIESDHSYPD